MRLFVVAVMSLLVLTPRSIVSAPAQSVKASDITEITLKNDGGFGYDRGYEVVLHEDGTAEYSGGQNNYGRKGKYRGQFDKRNFVKLAKLIIHQGFLSLKDRYEAKLLDAATVTTSIAYKGGRKTVRNYGSGGGKKIADIQIAIEAVANEVKWAKVE
jgi:hypothetical protein